MDIRVYLYDLPIINIKPFYPPELPEKDEGESVLSPVDLEDEEDEDLELIIDRESIETKCRRFIY